MQSAFAMIGLLGLLGGLAGTVIVTQRSALQVESLAHALLPGLIVAYVWVGSSTAGLLAGGFLAMVFTRLLSFVFSFHSRIDHTTGSTIVIGFNFALGLLLLSVYQGELPISLEHFILGDLLAVSWADNGFAGGLVLVWGGLVFVFYAPLKIFLLDPAYLARRGWPMVFTRIVVEVFISLATVLCFQAVGLVLTLSLLIVPVATIQLLAKHLWHMFVFGGILGALQGIVGLMLAYHLDLPSTPPIILISVGTYLLVLLQRAGSLRKNRS